MSADELKRYDANLRGCICCEGYVVMAPTEYGIGEYVTHKDAAATIQRLEAELAKHQESEFHPDWSMLEATRGTLREYREMLKSANAELTPLRALFPSGPLHEQVAAVLDQLRTPKVTNEMKSRFIGEFSWKEDSPYYDEDGRYHEHEAERVVPWDLCKKIYKEMAGFANAALQAGTNSGESNG